MLCRSEPDYTDIAVSAVFHWYFCIFTRPVAMKYFNKETIQTNANSLIGKKAVVIQGD